MACVASRALSFLPKRVPFTVAPAAATFGGRSPLTVPDRVVVEELRVDHQGLIANYPSSHHILKWTRQPKNVLVILKHGEGQPEAFRKVASLLGQLDADYNIIVEPHVMSAHAKEFPNLVPFIRGDPLEDHVDAVIALGGDGTLLHVSSLFQGAVPPVLSFATGSLGFLMPFSMSSCEAALRDNLMKETPFVPRMRLHCTALSKDGVVQEEYHAMNEVSLHRGREPSLAFLDIHVDGEPLTSTLADGIIVATPTGSTAYSLSAGGPVVHPNVKSILLTPICPRSLSFRPVALPVDSEVLLRLSPHSRGAAEASFDGRRVVGLKANECIRVHTSRFPVPTISRKPTSTADWVHDITGLLKWNQRWGASSV